MPNVNVIHINGNLVREPEMRFLPSGTELATFTIANNRSYKKGDEWQQDTTFIDCKAWGNVAKRASDIGKGTEVLISGRISQESWETQEGAKRSKIVIVADRVDVLRLPGERREESSHTPQPDLLDDDIPF